MPPRVNRVRTHGVFARSSSERQRLPPPPRSPPLETEQPPAVAAALQSPQEADPERKPTAKAVRLRWAPLLKRLFKTDIEQCPHCGGKRAQIAFITDGTVVHTILRHLGLLTEPPPIAPARAPPQQDLDF